MTQIKALSALCGCMAAYGVCGAVVMESEERRARQIRTLVEHFRKSAGEADNPYYRELMLRTASELEASAAALEAGRPLPAKTSRAA